MRIVFWGTPSFSAELLQKIFNSNNQLLAVISQPDKRRTRGRKLTYSAVKKKALDLDIPVITPTNIKDNSSLEDFLIKLKPDLFIVVAYGKVLPNNILDIPRLGCWNIHTSLLPRWRGAAPIQWALRSGDNKTGSSLMLMEEGLDTGPVFIEKSIDISQTDNYQSLISKLTLISSDILDLALKRFTLYNDINELKKELTPQNENNRDVTYARLIKKEDYKVNWDNCSTDIHNQIRAFYPNCYSFIDKKRIKILRTKPIDKSFESIPLLSSRRIQGDSRLEKPGTILFEKSKSQIYVVTSKDLLLVKEIQIEGKSSSSGVSLYQQVLSLNTNIMLNN